MSLLWLLSHTRPSVLCSLCEALGEEEAPLWIAGNNALLTDNQRNELAIPASGSKVRLCINVGEKNLFPAYVKIQVCPPEEKEEPYHQGSSSSSSGTTSDLVDRAEFVLGVQLRAVYWWLAGGSTLLQHQILPDLVPGSVHTEEIKELLEHWGQPERQKGSCLSMSVCSRAVGGLRDFGPGNDKCQQVFGFYNNI